MKTSGFDRVFFVQDKNKLNCIGEGTVSFEVRADTTKDAKLIFEMSSRELYSREMNEEERKHTDLDLFMDGIVFNKGDNKNSYFMTDNTFCPSKVEVFVNGKLLQTIDIKDNPADASGSLSWHYQKTDKLLDEAGSYGYLINIKIPKELLKAENLIELKTRDSISLYGRKSGKYPLEIKISQS